jgi:phospholipase C
MPKVTRRSFIAGATAAAAAGVAGSGVVAAAAAETAATAQAATSGLTNIQHVIIFMQENRSPVRGSAAWLFSEFFIRHERTK